VKKIVEEHGGMLLARNRPEGGACILIRLPVLGTAALSDDETTNEEKPDDDHAAA